MPGPDASFQPTTVCAIVVTHNRKDLLTACLQHLRSQSRPPETILVVDNASTDGTEEILAAASGIECLRLPVNAGGAGGFEAGLKKAHARSYDWYWLLDDDTLADPGCLAELLSGADRAPERARVMTSVVRWKDESLHPMNRPWPRAGQRGKTALAAREGLCPIRAATFVSTMIRREAVEELGLPPGHYFIWLDDIQYTARALREGAGYIAPRSTVHHWTPDPYSTVTDTRERFYYKVRNQLWLLRGDSLVGAERLSYALSWLTAIASYLRRSEPRGDALWTVARGLRDGLRPEPR